MTAKQIDFPYEKINLEVRHGGGAKILPFPQRQSDPLEDAMVAYYRWVISFTAPFNI